LANETILLIEDNPSDIELARRALERSHAANEMVVVHDGQEALDYLFGSGLAFAQSAGSGRSAGHPGRSAYPPHARRNLHVVE